MKALPSLIEMPNLDWKRKIDPSFLTAENQPQLLTSNQNQLNQQIQKTGTEWLRPNLPFWLWIDKQQHLDLYDLARAQNRWCCFVHGLGIPFKDGIGKPMFDYEKLIYDAMFEHKRVWIKKATGLGITEFFIYFMLWLALCRPRGLETWLERSHMVIVTGPREETARKIIKRAKDKLERAGIQNPDESKETVINIGDITIQAFPSFNASWRGLDKISVILSDESDFYKESEQEEMRAVSERYIGKSNAWIALVSTPNKPGGLFNRIENEDEATCLYHRIALDYHYGLGKIYTEDDINQAKRSPQFGREYECRYLGGIGNCFSEAKIQACINNEYDLDKPNPYALRAIGVDPGTGSPYGLCAAQMVNN